VGAPKRYMFFTKQDVLKDSDKDFKNRGLFELFKDKYIFWLNNISIIKSLVYQTLFIFPY
jgi:hypothetical protein